MKNATTYEKKIKKLLGRLGKKQSVDTVADSQPIAVLVRSVLEEDASEEQASKALNVLEHEFVDFNELRVSPHKEIVERIGKDYPGAYEKAEALTKALNAIFAKTNTISMEHLRQMTKRDLRRHLLEIGLSPYVAACIVLRCFDGHAIPVDNNLVECLKLKEYVHPDSNVPDVQGFLERIIPQKHALAAHEFFRNFVRKNSRALAAKRRAEARKQKEQEKAAAQAERTQQAAEKKAKRRPTTATKEVATPTKKAAKKKPAGKTKAAKTNKTKSPQAARKKKK